MLLQGPRILFNLSLSTVSIRFTVDPITWHWRLGHSATVFFDKIKSSAQLPVCKPTEHGSLCEPCQAKSKAWRFSESHNLILEPLKIIHSDLWSPLIVSNDDCKYFATFIDNFSQFTWIYPLQSKSRTFYCFIKFKCMAENLDGGVEFISNRFNHFRESNGIIQWLSCPTRMVQQKHRHIVETGLVLSILIPIFFGQVTRSIVLI